MPPQRNMPKPRGTRCLFVKYSVEGRRAIRPEHPRMQCVDEAEALWRSLDADQKACFVTAYKNLDAAKQKCQERANTARNLEQQARDTRNLLHQAVPEAVDPPVGGSPVPPPEPSEDEKRLEATRCYEVIELLESAVHAQEKVIIAREKIVEESTALANLVQEIHNNAEVMQWAAEQTGDVRINVTEAREYLSSLHVLADEPELPARVDGKLKVPESYVSERREKDRAILRRYALLEQNTFSSSAYPQARSSGGWWVGGGGQGSAGVWYLVDGNDNLVDRVLVKESFLDRRQWRDMTQWESTDGKVLDRNNRCPTEVATLQKLQQVHVEPDEHSVNISKIRSWHLNQEERSYRMILEYYGYGDLAQLIKRYRDYHENHGPAKIPEPFLWRTFHSLATAGFAMEHGHVDTYEPERLPVSRWREIVHRDLKPANILLGESYPGFFGQYPKPSIGDFGLAIYTSNRDILNPEIFLEHGRTHGYAAPEQDAFVHLLDLTPVDRFKLLAKTNVYGIGMIMFSLITHENARVRRDWFGEGSQDEHKISDEERHNFTWRYTLRLKRLIQSCIAFDPEKRPTFRAILAEIEEEFRRDGATRDIMYGVRPASDAHIERGLNNDLLVERTLYARALVRQDLPADTMAHHH